MKNFLTQWKTEEKNRFLLSRSLFYWLEPSAHDFFDFHNLYNLYNLYNHYGMCNFHNLHNHHSVCNLHNLHTNHYDMHNLCNLHNYYDICNLDDLHNHHGVANTLKYASPIWQYNFFQSASYLKLSYLLQPKIWNLSRSIYRIYFSLLKMTLTTFIAFANLHSKS